METKSLRKVAKSSTEQWTCTSRYYGHIIQKTLMDHGYAFKHLCKLHFCMRIFVAPKSTYSDYIHQQISTLGNLHRKHTEMRGHCVFFEHLNKFHLLPFALTAVGAFAYSAFDPSLFWSLPLCAKCSAADV